MSANVLGNASPYGSGQSLTLTCSISGGNPTPTVQWLKNGAAISGQISPSYTATTSSSSGGDYTCEATNSLGSVTSPAVTVVITGKQTETFGKSTPKSLYLRTTEPPTSVSVTGNAGTYANGATVSLTCAVAGGIPAPTLQWSRSGSTLSGETGTGLSFTGSASTGGDYRCTATNSAGSLTSSPATVIINREFKSHRPCVLQLWI